MKFKKIEKKDRRHVADFGEEHPIHQLSTLPKSTGISIRKTKVQRKKLFEESKGMKKDKVAEVIEISSKNVTNLPEEDLNEIELRRTVNDENETDEEEIDNDDDDDTRINSKNFENFSKNLEFDENELKEDENNLEDEVDVENELINGQFSKDIRYRKFNGEFNENMRERIISEFYDEQIQLENESTTNLYSYYSDNRMKIDKELKEIVQSNKKTNNIEQIISSFQLEKYHFNKKLYENFRNQLNNLGKLSAKEVTDLQLFSTALFNYTDIYLVHRKNVREELFNTYIVFHLLQHCLSNQNEILYNNQRMKELKEMNIKKKNFNMDKLKNLEDDEDIEKMLDEQLETDQKDDKIIDENEVRDRGIMKPTKLIKMLNSNRKEPIEVANKKRFIEEFSPTPGDLKRMENNSRRDRGLKYYRPKDFNEIFDGNIDDHFRIGIKIEKSSMKLYSSFYSANIIIASPLGLRTIIGNEPNVDGMGDFLAGIEILFVDSYSSLRMQNVEHLNHVLSHLNNLPNNSHTTDLSRVRLSALDGHSRFFRQTILLSRINRFEGLSYLLNHSRNQNGLLQLSYGNGEDEYLSYVGVKNLKQTFIRVPSNDDVKKATALEEKRFDYFKRIILPLYDEKEEFRSTIIFIPSYFNYLRIRNYMKQEEMNFLSLTEYSTEKDINKARALFYHGQIHYLLVTERFHFFRRYCIRGGRYILFYDIPYYPIFYSEFSNMLETDEKFFEDYPISDKISRVNVLYHSEEEDALTNLMGEKLTEKLLNSKLKENGRRIIKNVQSLSTFTFVSK
ncbi:hypothetical protein SNEBB_003123 [Seison nebaliae]|nr:hypothetical protein SNEBB_003123 [Seison nebaliae]